MVNGRYEETGEGTPQGGPLQPLLAIYCSTNFDKELERRGHPFVAMQMMDSFSAKSQSGRTSKGEYHKVHRVKTQTSRKPRKDECSYVGKIEIPSLQFLYPQRKMPPAATSKDRSTKCVAV